MRQLALILFLLWTMDYGLWTAPACAQTSNRIVAVVNDDVVTQADLDAFMAGILEHDSMKDAKPEELTEVRRSLLGRLIQERMILQEAKRLGLTVTSDEVLERLKTLQQRLGSREAYLQMLAEMDISEERLKRQLRDQVLVQHAIQREVRSKISLSPTEAARAASAKPAEAGAAESKVQHIMIRITPERDEDEAKSLATHLYERLVRGGSFDDLARKHSDDPHAPDGGQMGWVAPGMLMPELDDAVRTIAPGELSQPIRSKLGFHLVKVLERRTITDEQLMDNRRQAEQQILGQKFNDAMARWLKSLEKKSYIEISPEI